ncbi:MAG: hypothetical protein H7Z37_14220, partial [Pyrinomonadaceae bacterium]|nr:hypothetical protein [Pyrinomonadaceae bacterium]
QDNNRARQFFGNEKTFDRERFNAMKTAFAERIKFESNHILTSNDFKSFVETRANHLQLTAPRTIKIFNPESELNSLFRNLVGGRQRKESSLQKRRNEITQNLERLLVRRGISDLVKRDVKIDVPLLNSELIYPLMYQNGQPNVVQTVAFEGKNSEIVTRACRLAIEGQGLQELPTPHKLSIVATITPNHAKSKHAIEAMFNKNHVELYFDSEAEKFVDLIAETAH